MTDQLSGLIETQAWVSYLDIYGFKSIVGHAKISSGSPSLFSRLAKIHSTISTKKRHNTVFFILSDNYFIVNPVGDDPMSAYENCLADVRLLIDLHVDADLPLRGGIAFGPVFVGQNVLIGEPVIRAVGYERLSRLPLVLLPQREVEFANLGIKPPIFINHAVVDEHNTAGIISATFIVPRTPRTYVDYSEDKCRYYKIHGPEKVAKDWLDTVRVLSAICGSPS